MSTCFIYVSWLLIICHHSQKNHFVFRHCHTLLLVVGDEKGGYGGGYGGGSYGGSFGRSSASGYGGGSFSGMGSSRMRANADSTNFAADVTYPGAGNFFGQQAYN